MDVKIVKKSEVNKHVQFYSFEGRSLEIFSLTILFSRLELQETK
jgi:hypothetical protein